MVFRSTYSVPFAGSSATSSTVGCCSFSFDTPSAALDVPALDAALTHTRKKLSSPKARMSCAIGPTRAYVPGAAVLYRKARTGKAPRSAKQRAHTSSSDTSGTTSLSRASDVNASEPE